MDNTIIIILGIILLLLILLNHITIIQTTTTTEKSNCSQTAFGCCPDGINSKVNYFGTNCPGYRPVPGYPNPPTPVPMPPVPPPPGPGPAPPKPIGGCAGTRYGCCPNGITPKMNDNGTNCI